MSAFSEAWLNLREPLDAASRDAALVATLNAALPDRPLVVTDLAAGTGANLRYLSPRLGGSQLWRLIDHDNALLDAVPARLDDWARTLGATLEFANGTLIVKAPAFDCRIERIRRDLARGIDDIDVPTRSLVTASALLDLVSAPWLEALADRCRRADATALLALTYDGRIDFDPPDAGDGAVVALVNRHQQTDKGFGPALGPAASDRAAALFSRLDFLVDRARSDWRIGNRDRRLQDALLADWVSASQSVAAEATPTIDAWAERRSRMTAAGARLVVGHSDLLARPAGT